MMCSLLYRPVCCVYGAYILFFFKQKTAYQMRISDWSSDVCSSDLSEPAGRNRSRRAQRHGRYGYPDRLPDAQRRQARRGGAPGEVARPEDRKSVVSGKSVSVRVDLGGRRIMNKKTPALA